MSIESSDFDSLDVAAYWRKHYNSVEGPKKVAARRAVYDCVPEGEKPADFNFEVRAALGHAGLRKEAMVVDVGCGDGDSLEAWELAGHQGRLVGIEPNTEQLHGRPFWQPKESDETLEKLKREGDLAKVADYYELCADQAHEPHGRIEFYKADANFIPIPDGAAGVVTCLFSLYHVEKAKQSAALEEAKRVGSIVVEATSGNENKAYIRQAETEIAAILSDLKGEEVSPPLPISGGRTVEDAKEDFHHHFRHGYMYELGGKYDRDHSGRLVFDDESSFITLLNSFWASIDLYQTKSGQVPTTGEFLVAQHKVIAKHLRERGIFEDKDKRALLIYSDRQLNLPKKFKQLQ